MILYFKQVSGFKGKKILRPRKRGNTGIDKNLIQKLKTCTNRFLDSKKQGLLCLLKRRKEQKEK